MANFVRKMIRNQIKNLNQNKHTNFESIYIHIPFCEIKCPYCDFNAYSNIDNLTSDLIKAMKVEIDLWASLFEKKDIKSIYFGGGTPSWIDAAYIKDILRSISNNFNVSDNTEITLECNPIDLTNEKISTYINAGISRFSVGIQSLNDKTLKFIGRNHDRMKALNSLNNLRSNNVTNFSVDIMYGIPYQTHEEIKETVNTLLEFEPSHFSSYSFTIEPNTPFFKYVKENKIKEIDEEEYLKIFNILYLLLKENNYVNYEISNWAKKGFESIHNLNYWDNNKFLGIGPGAHSYINNFRFFNESSPKKYINKISKQNSLNNFADFADILQNFNFISGKDNISEDTKIKEYMIFSLRKNSGLDKNQFYNEFTRNLEDYISSKFDDFLDLQILENNKDIFKLTDKGKLLSNEVFREILYPEG